MADLRVLPSRELFDSSDRMISPVCVMRTASNATLAFIPAPRDPDTFSAAQRAAAALLDLVVVREPLVTALKATPQEFHMSVPILSRQKLDTSPRGLSSDGVNSFSLPVRIVSDGAFRTPLPLLNAVCGHLERLTADVTRPP